MSCGEDCLDAQTSAVWFFSVLPLKDRKVTCMLCGRAVWRRAPEPQLAVAAVASVQIDVVRLSGQHQQLYTALLPPAKMF